YFMWYMWFLPLVLPRMAMSMQMAIVVISAWISAQAVWLSLAYRLEFLGEEVYLPLWGASGLFLVLNSFVLVRLLQAYTPTV
ncbi:GPI mannosyltransferase 1, partial [Tulasnella sp. 403]